MIGRILFFYTSLFWLFLSINASAEAQEEPTNMAIPNILKIATTYDYPPFVFEREDGRLAGFEVELIEKMCERLKRPCFITQYPFDQLLDALKVKKANLAIAALKVNDIDPNHFRASDVYWQHSARFIAHRDIKKHINLNSSLSAAQLIEKLNQSLERKVKIGVAQKTTHELMLKDMSKEHDLILFKSIAEAYSAIKNKEIDLIFSDSLYLDFWVMGDDSENCCVKASLPFYNQKYLGEGIGIIANDKDLGLIKSVNEALSQMQNTNLINHLKQKYMP